MKKELIAGTLIVIGLALFIIDTIARVTSYEHLFDQPIFSEQTSSIIGWFLTLDTIFLIFLIAWRIYKQDASIERLRKHFSVRATIPGHFIYALTPIGMGVGLMAITGNYVWGSLLAGLSFPAALIFMYLELKQTDTL